MACKTVTLSLSLTARQLATLTEGFKDLAQQAKDEASEHDALFFERLFDLLCELGKDG